ncbi:MAG TPA: 30S ribosomal protein S21 [Elusimicrobia bacterium]|jgi:small subunit ribosomal protein S21|nr:30S ribosomal protein S21 [Elusimicrobiota bacterium]
MIDVKIREGESIEEALRRFKRECERDGILQEIRRREFFESQGARRKRKLSETLRRMKRKRLYSRYKG